MYKLLHRYLCHIPICIINANNTKGMYSYSPKSIYLSLVSFFFVCSMVDVGRSIGCIKINVNLFKLSTSVPLPVCRFYLHFFSLEYI